MREHFSRFVGPVIDKVLGDKRDKGQVIRGTRDRSVSCFFDTFEIGGLRMKSKEGVSE